MRQYRNINYQDFPVKTKAAKILVEKLNEKKDPRIQRIIFQLLDRAQVHQSIVRQEYIDLDAASEILTLVHNDIRARAKEKLAEYDDGQHSIPRYFFSVLVALCKHAQREMDIRKVEFRLTRITKNEQKRRTVAATLGRLTSKHSQYAIK